jgi:hypothetical protein
MGNDSWEPFCAADIQFRRRGLAMDQRDSVGAGRAPDYDNAG